MFGQKKEQPNPMQEQQPQHDFYGSLVKDIQQYLDLLRTDVKTLKDRLESLSAEVASLSSDTKESFDCCGKDIAELYERLSDAQADEPEPDVPKPRKQMYSRLPATEVDGFEQEKKEIQKHRKARNKTDEV